MNRSTAFCCLLRRTRTLSATQRYSKHPFVPYPPPARPIFSSQITRSYSKDFVDLSPSARLAMADRALGEVAGQAESGREAKIKAGVDLGDADKEDFFGIHPLIKQLERRNVKEKQSQQNRYEEPSDSDTESDDDQEAVKKRSEMFDKKFKQLERLLDRYAKSDSFDDSLKWMKRIDEFEEKHFALRPEYRVIGALMNKLKVAEGKDKFLLQVKLNRALKLAEARDAFDPNDPANYGIIERQDAAASAQVDRDEDPEREEDFETKDIDEFGGLEFDTLKQKDNVFVEKINGIDKKLEEKLAELAYTFGRKGKQLEEEIKDLAEERNTLIEQKRQPLYRKGFDVRLVDMNRTCKVTKGGQVIKYSAILVCGNYNGVIGYAKAKAPAVPIALQKAREKCFQNLHYVERHENHTVAHAIQTSYKKTKLYLWPAPTQSGMKAGRTVQLILNLAGYKNVKSKVVGSRNPHNTVKAVFKALNAIETPKDVQEKFGRTVVESYLL